MKTRIFIYNLLTTTAIAVASMMMSACSNDDDNVTPHKQEAKPLVVDEAQKTIIAAHNKFAHNFFAYALKAANGDNVAVSPLSAEIALSMLANAADGETQTELLNVLGYSDMTALNSFNRYMLENLPMVDPSLVRLDLCNSVWLNSDWNVSLTPAFTNTLDSDYSASVTSLPFSNFNINIKANEWVDEKTQGMINKFYEEDEDLSRLNFSLLNAMYFNGKWNENCKFDKKKTEPADFTYTDESGTKATKKVEMMTTMYTGFGCEKPGEYKAVKLYYGQNAFYMLIVVPEDGQDINYCMSNAMNVKAPDVYWQPYRLTLKLPRFENEATIQMTPFLIDAGIDMERCNLSNVLSDGKPVIDEQIFIKQCTAIKVYEEGTEAAAVTGIDGVGATLIYPLTVTADRPFGYAIVEKESNTIIMMGAFQKP
ncbi:MAG: serpin family protein [Bacteroidales bacterium]|nr:serpin family protein [Bacteroidales bacterium]